MKKMNEQDSHSPYLLSSETTAKGTGLAESAGEEDLVEPGALSKVWDDLPLASQLPVK